jgi:uncharacterized protein YndB with AHSA1/START domain
MTSAPRSAIRTEADDPTVLVISRLIDAPRALVWRLWTDPAHAMRWMGPVGFTATHFAQDARPGGRWRLCLTPDTGGPSLWQGGVCLKAVEPETLVYTFAWQDEAGRATGPDMFVTVTFAEDGDRTRLTFRQEGFASVAMRDGHRDGWSSSFARLADTAIVLKQTAA